MIIVVLLSLEGCNRILLVSRKVKGRSAKIPVACPSIEKEYNNGMDDVDLLDQRTAV